MKVCKGCEISKEVTEFNKNLKMKDGLLNFCKEHVMSSNPYATPHI